MVERIITGNRLEDGKVIFLGRDGAWSPDINHAKIADTDADAELLEKLGKIAEQARFVVGPYAIVITREAGHLQPVIYQERLRAFGPSSHPEYGRDDVPWYFRDSVAVKRTADFGDGI